MCDGDVSCSCCHPKSKTPMTFDDVFKKVKDVASSVTSTPVRQFASSLTAPAAVEKDDSAKKFVANDNFLSRARALVADKVISARSSSSSSARLTDPSVASSLDKLLMGDTEIQKLRINTADKMFGSRSSSSSSAPPPPPASNQRMVVSTAVFGV
jgi:hypothetical protein